MMKYTVVILCFFYGLMANGQNPTKEKSQWGLDFHYLGSSIHFAHSIKKLFYLGGEFGILPDKLEWFIRTGQYFSEKNTIWSNEAPWYNIFDSKQQLYLHFFVRLNSNTKRFQFDFGVRRAYYKRSLPHFDDYSYPRFTGVYLKPVIGYEKLKIGLKMDVGKMFQKDGTIIEEQKELVLVGGVFIRLKI